MNRNIWLLILIIVLALVAIYIDLPSSPGIHIALGPIQIDKDFDIRQGLDLQGGVQVLLVADLPADQEIEEGSMRQVATIVKPRQCPRLSGPVVQLQGSRRIIVELRASRRKWPSPPSVDDLLEFRRRLRVRRLKP